VNKRFRKSSFRNELKNNNYTFNLSIYNIVEELLNFIAEITDCKQFILYVLIQKVTDNEMIYNKK